MVKEELDFATIINHVNTIVIGVSARQTITLFNEKAQDFFGILTSDAYQQNIFDLFEPLPYQLPISPSFFKNPSRIHVEQQCRNHYNQPCFLKWTVVPLGRIQELAPYILFTAEVHDEHYPITKFLSQIINVTPGSLYWKDKAGKYLGCNTFMVKTANLFHIEDIVGKTDLDLWPESAPHIRMNDLRVITAGETLFTEEAVTIHTGEYLYFTGVKMPLRDETGEIVGVIGNSLDITSLKRAEKELVIAKEKAEAADIAKTLFMRNMEHDLRTPFTGLYGLSTILWEAENDVQKKELLGDIAQSAKELLDYCNSILDFSMIEQNQLPILNKKFNLQNLAERLLTMEKPVAIHKKIDLRLLYDSHLPQYVLGDEHRLFRILINLVSNALKFTEYGYVSLHVILRNRHNKNIIVNFRVEDTGIGIPADKINFIYEKFGRLMPSNQGKYKGLGLGLPIVKRFVEEMNGEITVEGSPTGGTVFNCLIPFSLPLLQDSIK